MSQSSNVFILAAVIGAARLTQMAAAQPSSVNTAALTDVSHTTHWLVDTIEYFFDQALPLSFVWLAIFLTFLFLAYIVPRLAASICLRCVSGRHWVLFWQHLFTIGIITYGLWLAFAAIGVDATGLAFTFGIFSLAISQGAGTLIGNALSALAMQTTAEISVGRTLEVAGVRGRIVAMDLRQVTLVPSDDTNSRVYIPNNILAQTIHRVYQPTRRQTSPTESMLDSESRSAIETMARVGGKANKFNFDL